MKKWSRRAALAGAGAVVAGGTVLFGVRKGSEGGSHSEYFARRSAALRRAGVAQPAIVVDTERLQANIDAARRTLQGRNLPSP